jgi:NhaP-type Na+/H+ or K+/H+ antiporter
MDAASPTLTLVLALGAGVLAQSVARHLRIPGIVLLLAAGASLGPDGIAWVQPHSLGEGLFAIVDLAVAVILFEGGLNLDISRLRREQTPIRRLVTVGALVTLVGGTLAVRALLDWPWMPALLFGSLVVVTGPTVIGPLVGELRLRSRVATVLEAEGVLIDPIGAILAVLMLEFALAPDTEPLASGAMGLLFRLGFGVAAGLLAGLLLAGLLRVRRLIPEGYENILTLAAVLVLFQGCDEVVSESGILAVTVAGVVVGNMPTHVDRDLREFKDQLSVLLIGLLFVLLAADVRVVDVQALGWRGLAVVAALVLVVRPLNVWLTTAGSELSVRERLLIAWLAPRGIVAAAVASLVAGALESRGLEGGAELRALVFLTISGTVLLAGLTGRPVATLLRVRLPGRDTVAILGAQGLGLAVASELRDAEIPVVFLDANPQNCRRAEEAGYAVVYGNALEERTLQRARFDGVGTAVGLTPNETLNGLFVARARELSNVPRTYVALTKLSSGVTPAVVRSQDAEILFEGPHDVERWDVRARNGDLAVEHMRLGRVAEGGVANPDTAASLPSSGERFVILTIRRAERIFLMSLGFRLREGDAAAIAVHVPEREEAQRLLAEMGWAEQPAPEND